VGGYDIRLGRMRCHEFLVAIKFIGRLEGTLLHLVENILHVHDLPAFKIELNPHPQEFFHENGNVEFDAVITSQVATLQKGSKILRLLPEGGLILYILVINSVNE